MHSKRLNAWAEKKAHFRQAEVGQIDDSLGVRKGLPGHRLFASKDANRDRPRWTRNRSISPLRVL